MSARDIDGVVNLLWEIRCTKHLGALPIRLFSREDQVALCNTGVEEHKVKTGGTGTYMRLVPHISMLLRRAENLEKDILAVHNRFEIRLFIKAQTEIKNQLALRNFNVISKKYTPPSLDVIFEELKQALLT